MADFLKSYYEEGFFPTHNLIGSLEESTGNTETPQDATAQSLVFSLDVMNIKEYDGNERHQPLHAFLERVDKVRLTRPNVTELELVRLAISKCTGHAYGILKPAISTIKNLEQLKEALQLSCGTFDNPEIYEVQLITCKQERNESVNGFHQRICEIQHKLERCREPDLRENGTDKQKRLLEEKAKVLKRGLLPRYRDEVRRKGLTDANQILKLAKEEELFSSQNETSKEEIVASIMPILQDKLTLIEQQLSSTNNWPAAAPAHQSNARSSGLSVAAASFHPAASQHQRGALVSKQQQELPNNWMQQSQHSKQRDFYEQNNINQKVPAKNQKCYNCDRTGHYKSNCMLPPCCMYCGDLDHTLQSCPKIPCIKCNSFGHMPRTCNSR